MKCTEKLLHANGIDDVVRQRIANEFLIPLSILNKQCMDRQYEMFLVMHRADQSV